MNKYFAGRIKKMLGMKDNEEDEKDKVCGCCDKPIRSFQLPSKATKKVKAHNKLKRELSKE
jgi:hypothetical protein